MCNSQRSPISIAMLSAFLALSMACSRRPGDEQIAKDIQDKAAVDPDTKESQSRGIQGRQSHPQWQSSDSRGSKEAGTNCREEPGNSGVDDQTTVDPDAIGSPQIAPAMAAALPPIQKPKPSHCSARRNYSHRHHEPGIEFEE